MNSRRSPNRNSCAVWSWPNWSISRRAEGLRRESERSSRRDPKSHLSGRDWQSRMLNRKNARESRKCSCERPPFSPRRPAPSSPDRTLLPPRVLMWGFFFFFFFKSLPSLFHFKSGCSFQKPIFTVIFIGTIFFLYLSRGYFQPRKRHLSNASTIPEEGCSPQKTARKNMRSDASPNVDR